MEKEFLDARALAESVRLFGRLTEDGQSLVDNLTQAGLAAPEVLAAAGIDSRFIADAALPRNPTPAELAALPAGATLSGLYRPDGRVQRLTWDAGEGAWRPAGDPLPGLTDVQEARAVADSAQFAATVAATFASTTTDNPRNPTPAELARWEALTPGTPLPGSRLTADGWRQRLTWRSGAWQAEGPATLDTDLLADIAQSAALAVSAAGITPVADLAAVPAQPGLYRTMDTGRVYERVSDTPDPQRREPLEVPTATQVEAARSALTYASVEAMRTAAYRPGTDLPVRLAEGLRWRYDPQGQPVEGRAVRGYNAQGQEAGVWVADVIGPRRLADDPGQAVTVAADDAEGGRVRTAKLLSGGRLARTALTPNSGESGVLVENGQQDTVIEHVTVTVPGGSPREGITVNTRAARTTVLGARLRGGHHGLLATSPDTLTVIGSVSEGADNDAYSIGANAGQPMQDVLLLGNAALRSHRHGVQVFAGDPAVNRVHNGRRVIVSAQTVGDPEDGAGVWANNVQGLAFGTIVTDNTPGEGLDLENVWGAAVGNSAVINSKIGAVTALFGTRNAVYHGIAIEIDRDLMPENQNIAGVIGLVRDDCKNVLFSGIVAECRVPGKFGTFQIRANGAAVPPENVTFVGCVFRNVIFESGEYMRRVRFIDCVFEYDRELPGYPLMELNRADYVVLRGCRWYMLGAASYRNGVNQAPVVITQGAGPSAEGQPMTRNVWVEGCELHGFPNSGIAVLTFAGAAPDDAQIVYINNAAANLYRSGSLPRMRATGNFHPVTMTDVAVTVV